MEIAPSTLEQFKTPEQEIAYLREQVARKERELHERGISLEREPILHEQVAKYRHIPTQEVLHQNFALAETVVDGYVAKLAPERHDKKVKELVALMQEKGIKNVLTILTSLNDPHVTDDFERYLVQYVRDGGTFKHIPNEFEKALHMTLYEVSLSSGSEKPLAETLSAMKQFFAGMMSIESTGHDEHFAIEIANANGSGECIMYVAVPFSKKDLFEKQATALFPGIRVVPEPNDYNIFNESGVSLALLGTAKTNPIFPLASEFAHDPMNVILNTFSKIQTNGQGAAIQFIIRPREDVHSKSYHFALSQIEKGTPLADAIKPETWGKGFGGAFKNIFGSTEKKDEEKKVSESDLEKVAAIKKKVADHIFSTNIRLVVSAETEPEASRIGAEIESSFNQFGNQDNAIAWQRAEKSVLKNALQEFSFRLFNPHHDFPLNLSELSALVHFSHASYATAPQVKRAETLEAPAPLDISSSGVVLGKNMFRGNETLIRMHAEDRLRHVYTIGQTGTGKTTLLKNMIVQDIIAGEGVCFIDPHGTDIVDILANVPKERIDDVIYFDPAHTAQPMALNMLEYDRDKPEQKTFVVNELFSIFQKLYGAVPESMGPMFEQYFRNATMLVIEDPESGSTLLDVSRVMADKAYRQLKLSRCKNPVVVQFWQEVAEKAGGEAALANIVPYITSKFDVFLANDIMRPIVAQEKSSFNFRDIMDKKKILLVNLSKGRLGDINANLIGLILVGKILMAALSRVDLVGMGGFPNFYLYIDEFQNITTNSIATILSEARKYRLSLNIAHQFIAQLEQSIRDAVFGNVGSIISFRISSDDAEYLEKQFAPVFSARDLQNLDNRHAAVKLLVNGRPAKPFNIVTLPPPQGNPAMIESLRQLSYLKFGGEREEIEAEILRKYRK